ncbi:response regulator [Desulfobacula sp.]|uniref:response regulator n=1 Tax=Desulfobacula sp. TaxID=2593537 RepID=UPI002633CBF6|nr:response regulator [Desulfobacula sp.]
MAALKEHSTAQNSVAPHILIMEDDLHVAKGLKMILDEQGYTVDLEATGQGAMEAMGRYDYDLLMADLRLPDIDGMQVVKQIKETRPETEVIVMTGYATSSLAVNAMKLGAHDFIAKPFTEEQIKSSITEALHQNSLALDQDTASSIDPDNVISIQKREVLNVLNRTCEDEQFWTDLMEKGSLALDQYTLSVEAKGAVASGDLKWINENIGELTQKQLMFVYKRLEREAW